MSEQKQGNGGPAAITAEDVTKARADGHAAGIEEGKAALAPAIAAERARIKAITTSPEAEGRPELAAHCAFDTDMTAEAATALMSKSPKAQAQSPLDRAMEAAGAGASLANQPAKETATQPVIDSIDIFARRAAAAKQKR